MRVALVLLAAGLAVLAAAIVYTRAGSEEPAAPRPQASATPSFEQRSRLSEQITRDRDGLTLQGVYLVGVTLEDACARVSLLNPTAANIAYVERRFRGACVARDAGAPAKTCREATRGLTRNGAVTVPSVLDLRPGEASRRLLAVDLAYSLACLGDEKTAAWDATAPQDALLRVIAQCPRAGERVRAGTEVALQAAIMLPGGFQYTVGALDEAATGTTSPCGDRRNPRG